MTSQKYPETPLNPPVPWGDGSFFCGDTPVP